MPPKKITKKRTREATESDSEPEQVSTTKNKASGSKKAKKEDTVSVKPQPTNLVLPVRIEFPPKITGTTRIATWNICGIAASQKKGFQYYVEAEDADILILTETKVNVDPAVAVLNKRYPHRYWSAAFKKGYAGTAILCKTEPISVDYSLPGHPEPDTVKGRIVTLEFPSLYLVGTYVVNAGTGLKTLDAKKLWNTHFETYIRALDAKKPVIWGGDLNVAPTEMDLKKPKNNWNKSAGYTEAETSSFARILNPPEDIEDAKPFVDIWRKMHPKDEHYTYFSYRFQCREKGIGWRLDSFVLSERISNRVKLCEIRDEIYGASDHCPVTLEIDGDL
ncbi:Endonuclease/exonuclease/phosphatase [Cristinia sonorae]|uniref:Endonuclease/exonuclease/phosphatase n=1 Tax=Cristinia sonorae TaxID=1940300 RepID=A0A8K0XUY6_9AGAR|nr:Endonuclease/exonuclease/phosphatase [Cristinia sonorae]